MKKIMFVCHGNICRSPMAEFIFRKITSDSKTKYRYFVESSATSTEEIWGNVGNPVYPPAKAELLRHGITCDGKRAVQLKRSDYERYDLFVAMDSMNVRNIMRIFGKDPQSKVCKLMDFTDRKGDVADPWYTRRFDVTYKDVYEGCTALLDYLEKGEN